VLPPALPSGWVGVGIGGQPTQGAVTAPPKDVLALWASGIWTYQNHSGQVSISPTQWLNLTVSMIGGDPEATQQSRGWIDGKMIVSTAPIGDAARSTGAPPKSRSAPFAFLAASWSTDAGNHPGPDSTTTVSDPVASNAEFKHLCLDVTELQPDRVTEGPPPAPPSPGPPPPPASFHGLALVACGSGDEPRQLWTFSGEDRGEAGTLRSSSNASACLGAAPPRSVPVRMHSCGAVGTPAHAEQLWTWSSQTGILASQEMFPCIVSAHGESCSMCLDEESRQRVDLFDCKRNPNQKWSFEPNQVGGPFPSWNRSILTETYLCHARSCQVILRMGTAGQGASQIKKGGLCLTLY
jgi:hypothetical protein